MWKYNSCQTEDRGPVLFSLDFQDLEQHPEKLLNERRDDPTLGTPQKGGETGFLYSLV